jgi:hypothetical protein
MAALDALNNRLRALEETTHMLEARLASEVGRALAAEAALAASQAAFADHCERCACESDAACATRVDAGVTATRCALQAALRAEYDASKPWLREFIIATVRRHISMAAP